MTNLDIEKEAHRVVHLLAIWKGRPAQSVMALEHIKYALRTVHDRAIEDAVKIAEDEDCVCTDEVNCNGNYRIADKVRAFKIGDGK